MASYLPDFEDAQKTVYVIEPPKKKARSTFAETARSFHKEEVFDTNDTGIFPRLLGGDESQELCNLRWQKFQDAWQYQQTKIDRVLLQEMKELYERVRQFMFHGGEDVCEIKKLRTALFYMGSNISNHSRNIDDLCEYITREEGAKVVITRISSRNCPSLIAAISQVIASFESDTDVDEEVDELNSAKKFDLQPLFNALHKRGLSLSVVFQDADSLPPNILEPLLDLLNNSGPLVNVSVLLGISTPLSVFQDKLSRETIRSLNAQPFEIESTQQIIDRVLETVLFNTEQVSYNDLIMGPKVLELLWKSRDQNVLSVTQFISLLRYLFLIHYYEQPLSVIWGTESAPLSERHIAVMRSLNSVTSFIIQVARDPETPKEDSKKLLNDVLNNNNVLVDLVDQTRDNLFTWLSSFSQYIDMVYMTHRAFGAKQGSKIEIAARMFQYQNGLVQSEFMQQTLERIRAASYGKLFKFYESFDETKTVGKIVRGALEVDIVCVGELYEEHPECVEMAATDRDLPKDCMSGLESIRESMLNLLLESEESCLVPWRNHEMVGKEMCTMELKSANPAKSILMAAFSPPARSTVLEALFEPRRYFENSHMNSNKREYTEASMALYNCLKPMLTELYHLYREANTVINIYDFYMAFQGQLPREKLAKNLLGVLNEQTFPDGESREYLKSMLEKIRNGDEESWNKFTLALFYQGVAELQLLGLMRDAKGGKTEIMDKLIWREL